MMKKLIILIISILCTVSLYAQHPRPQKPGECVKIPRVEEMVSDLSAVQKKRLETATNASKKKVAKLKQELSATRDQIKELMDKDEDMSSQLFPLVEKEAHLHAEITKEMYRCRIAIDEILTKEQLQEFRSRLKSDFEKSHGSHFNGPDVHHNRPKAQAKKAKK